ncbi:MAG: DUF3892 domain-containing protein [Faecousia sp.]
MRKTSSSLLLHVAGVGIAHRGDTECLKAIPNGSENDNLGNLPSVSPEPNA